MAGFRLIPFSEYNADVVLAWRNSERIRSNMLDDSLIEKKVHSNFLKLLSDDDSRAYFVVALKETPVASIYFTGLGGEEVTWGCYIGSQKPIPGLFLALVVIAARYAFSFPDTLTLRSEVASHNSSPVKMNRFLGISETERNIKTTSSGKIKEFIEFRIHSDELNSVMAKANKVMPSSINKCCEELFLEK